MSKKHHNYTILVIGLFLNLALMKSFGDNFASKKGYFIPFTVLISYLLFFHLYAVLKALKTNKLVVVEEVDKNIITRIFSRKFAICFLIYVSSIPLISRYLEEQLPLLNIIFVLIIFLVIFGRLLIPFPKK